MIWKTLPLELLIAVNAFDIRKRAANTLLIWGKVLIQVPIKLPQLSRPLTPITVVGTIHMKLVQGLFQPLVGKHSEWQGTRRTATALKLDTLDAILTVALATAADYVGVVKLQETDGTLNLEGTRWLFNKLAIVPTAWHCHFDRQIIDQHSKRQIRACEKTD